MQEKFPIFILIASELLDLSGASRDELPVSGAPGLGSPGGAQLRAESSPVPSEELPVTGGDSAEVTFHFQTAGIDPTSEMTADFIPVRTETAARATATLPKEVVRNLEGSDQQSALKLQDGDAFSNDLLSNVSVPTSARGSQATTHPEQSERSVPGKAQTVPEAAVSPTSSSAGLPQPTPTGGVHQDSRGVAAVSPIPVIKQTEVPSPKISLLTSTVNFHPPRKETAPSPFPTSVKMAFVSAGLGRLPPLAPPTTKRPRDASPQVQPDSRAAVTPTYVKRTRSVDAQFTTSAFPQKPASVGLDAAYFRVTQTTAVQFSPLLSLNQEPAGSEGRNSVTAVINGSRHTTLLPALQQLLQGNVQLSSLLMHPEALGHDELIPPPFQGPIDAADKPQPLLLSQTLNCTKHHASHDTNRSAQESTVLALQRDADHLMMTSKPEKSRSSKSPQASSNSSSSGQSQSFTLNLSQTTRELKGATSPLLPGASTFEKTALPPVTTSAAVHAALQPLATSVASYAGLQPMGVPTSAARGLHILTSSAAAGSGSQVRGVSAHPGPREAFAVVPQMSTVGDSKGQKSLPHQIDKAGSPPLTPQASVVSSPSGLHDENQKASLDSSAPSASPIQHAGSLEAFVGRLHPPHAQESQSSTTTARPEPAVPVVSEIPAHLAQALLQQFGASHDAATKNLSALRTDHPKMLPSSLYLSFLLRNTDGMICLLPMQESPLPASFPNVSVGTLVSVQQILAASNSSLADLANLRNGSPSSLILVKPVFILFPTDRADLQMVPSPQGEDDHKSALSFTNKQGQTVVTHEHSRDIPEKTSSSHPTSESLRPQTTLSTASDQRAEKAKVTSQPVLTTASYVAIPSSFQATAPAAARLLDPQLRTSTAAQAPHLQGLPEELQAAAAPSPGAEVPSPGGMATEPPASLGPPVLVRAQHSPPTAPTGFFKAEKPLSFSVTPLLSAVGLAGLPMPAQPPFTVAGAVGQVQHGTGLTLQTTTHGQGSVSPSSSARAPCTDCLSSARTVKYPLKMSPNIVPLQSTSQSQLSTESLQRLPSQVPFVPSAVLAFSVFPAGNDGRGSAAGSTASSGVTLRAKAAPVPPTSIKPDLTKHLEFVTIVPKPVVRTETPTPVPARTLFATKVKTAASGKLLATSTPPRMYGRSPASLPSPVSAHVPLPSAVKREQSSRAPSALFSPANVGENGKPTEGSASPRKMGAGGFLGTSTSLPAVFSTKTEQPPAAALGSQAGVAPAQPSAAAEPMIALESEPKLTQTTSPSPLAVTSLSAAKNDYITASFSQKKVFFLPTSALQSDPNVVFPTIAVMSSSAKVPASGAKSEGVFLKGDTATASQVPGRAATSSAPRAREEKVPLGASTEQEAGHSSQHAAGQAAGPSTAKSLSVPASKVTNRPAALNKAAADGAEMLLTRDLSPLPPSLGSPSHPAGAVAARTAASDPWPGATATAPTEGLLPGTEAEEEAGPHGVTHGDPAGSESALMPPGSEPRALLSESRQRRVLQQDGAVLSGIAVVSDEACGSGNYTVQMSLRPAAEASPELQGSAPPQDAFLASLAVRSSSSQPVLRVRSCCVTPSSSPGGPSAVCCLLPRLLSECRHIQLLQSSEPRAASFTIQPFQVLNHSVAYLHCELNVCLHGKPGCEQGCFDSVEPLPQPGDRNSPGQLHNLISFGPVLRTKDRFLYKPVEGPDSAMLVPVLLGSLTGFAVLGSAFISLWLHHRRKTKSLGCPQFGEIRGL
ncbi:mucin-19-like isoform X1 [Anser cygnoides]|uniref:mucin-19-like isoform X1 n=2 Tax=Anser cygnoides TaxID=8845 RepID=UPI0034D2478E